MASAILHLAIAKQLKDKLNIDNISDYYLGSIAPDISKNIGESKNKSHFIEKGVKDIPNIDKFLAKYKNNLNDDFVLGYYIHLYVDYLWFKYFIPEINENDLITKLDGTVVKCSGNMAFMYIYNDYTNINVDIIDEYDLDLKIFYNELPKFDNIIKEIPMDKLYLIVNKASEILENSKKTKEFVFNMNNINEFISLCVDIILSDLKILI